MKFVSQLITSATIATTAILGISTTTYATTLNFDLEFATSNQSIWDTGKAFTFTDNRSLEVKWNESVSKGFNIPNPFGSDPRVGFDVSTRGKIGLKSNLNLYSGAVNALIPVDLFITLPDQPIKAGQTFNVQSGFSFGSDATFTTTSPSASYNLDVIFDLATTLNVDPGRILDFSFNKKGSQNLLHFDTKDLKINVGGSFGTIKAHFPNVNTTGNLSGSNQLTSAGKDKFVKAAVDLDLLATHLLGLPPLEGSKSIGLGVNFNYNLLDAQAAAALSVLQQFSLTGTLPALLLLEDGTSIPFNIGDDIAVTMPSKVGKFLDIDAVIDFNALFSNNTTLGLDFDLDVLVGKFGLNIPILGKKSVGPLFEKSIDILAPSYEVFDKTFRLDGFNSQQVSFQVETVPEPTSILSLLAFSTLGVGSLLKRKKLVLADKTKP